MGRSRGETYKHTKCEQCRKNHRAKHRVKDLATRFRSTINQRLKGALLGRKRHKAVSKAEELLGCSIEAYIKYIESRWTGEMNWDNWGKVWQIDHIIECHKFDLTDDEQVKKCFNHTNTRPLPLDLNTWSGKR